MSLRRELRQLMDENRRAWNEATAAHNSHKRDQAGFLRRGGTTLFPEELELLGDIRGQRLAHLQCNSGQDTLSLARLGAQVTGVDFSEEAVRFAETLSAESGIRARFSRSDVFDWLEKAPQRGEQFEVAFSSYGAIFWLADIGLWAKGVASILSPRGRLVLVDFHPYALTFEYDWTPKYSYFSEGKATTWEGGIGDYVADSGGALAPMGYEEGVVEFHNPHATHEFTWTMSELVTALLDAGLSLSVFREYPYMNGARLFKDMVEKDGRRMYPPERMPSLPLMYGLVAVKP